MSGLLKVIDELRQSLWAEHGNALRTDYTQTEIRLTYYCGEVLRQNGHEWFRADGQEGACYTEKAAHAAFIAGLRLGQQEAGEIAERMVSDRMDAAIAALNGIN